jgi:hypothetical protein
MMKAIGPLRSRQKIKKMMKVRGLRQNAKTITSFKAFCVSGQVFKVVALNEAVLEHSGRRCLSLEHERSFSCCLEQCDPQAQRSYLLFP